MQTPDKPGKKSPNPVSNNREGLLNAFAKEIVHGNVVLLLGHESLLRIPSSKEAAEDMYIQMLRDSDGSMEKWMEILKENYYRQSSSNSLKQFFIDMFDEESSNYDDQIPRLDTGDLNPEILKLIESKAFRVVLTTTYDPLVEQAMIKAWGEGKFDVKNFGDSDNNDLISPDRFVLAHDVKPTLYYLFGKATNNVSNYGNPKFIVDEEDYIQIIRSWMVSPPKALMTYLSDKRILAIGCKFENWLFRFFWRAVLETKENKEDFKHLLAISLTSTPADQKLKEIFKLYNLKFPEDVNEFLKGLNHAIEAQKRKAFIEERREGGIFLSYCSKDFVRVLNLFYKLRDCGFKVWMDNSELKYGDSYKDCIKAAIQKATVFMPILSKEVSTHQPANSPYDENDANYHFYRDFEWKEAINRYNREQESIESMSNQLKIIPFALEDYNPREKKIPKEIIDTYNLIFEKTLDSYDKAGFARFIKILKDIFHEQ